MKVFDELLLDADWAVNAGMWMWLSSSSFFQQFFHCYCPVRFGRRADPNGDYIRKYLPVLKVSIIITIRNVLKPYRSVYKLMCLFFLGFSMFKPIKFYINELFSRHFLFYCHFSKKNFPTRYIHEPWNAPEGIQKAAKCIIGRGQLFLLSFHSKPYIINRYESFLFFVCGFTFHFINFISMRIKFLNIVNF